MALSSKSLAGPGYIILNILRVMNIVGLLAVITASVIMLVKTAILSKFFFFDACTHAITGFVSMFLIASELSIFRRHFARDWPLLSPDHGFVTLGGAMMVLGIILLGNLNREATKSDAIGIGFWRIIIGSGCIMLALGFLNIVASFTFRDSNRGITARHVRAHGAVAAIHQEQKALSSTGPLSSREGVSTAAPSCFSSPVRSPPRSFAAGSFVAGRSFRGGRRSLLPSYHTTPWHISLDQIVVSPARSIARSKKSTKSRPGTRNESVGPKMPINISGPTNVNRQFAHLVPKSDSAPPSRHQADGQGQGAKN